MQTHTIKLPSAALAYEKYGDGDVDLVIEMGLGASMAEWRQLAEKLAGKHTVLLYQRAGYGASSTSALERTPKNIAAELHLLLYQVGHDHKQYMGHGNTMLEVYTPGDMQAPDYECGIWVPVERT